MLLANNYKIVLANENAFLRHKYLIPAALSGFCTGGDHHHECVLLVLPGSEELVHHRNIQGTLSTGEINMNLNE